MENKYNILDKGYVEYKSHLGTDLDPVVAARISTQKPSGVNEEDDDRLRDYLYRHQHVSCFEYNILRVEVKVPIFVSRQIIRHRTLNVQDLTEGIPADISVNEFSARYADVISECYVPEVDRILGESKTNKQGSELELPIEIRERFVNDASSNEVLFKAKFDRNRNEGIAKEIARINAPVSNYTVLLLQGNLRNWLHFINLRIKPNAQYEIRIVAEAILNIIKDLWPKCYESFEEFTLNAESFSKTDIEIVRDLIEDALFENSAWQSQNSRFTTPEECFDNNCQKFGLNKTRIRELKQKLKLFSFANS